MKRLLQAPLPKECLFRAKDWGESKGPFTFFANFRFRRIQNSTCCVRLQKDDPESL